MKQKFLSICKKNSNIVFILCLIAFITFSVLFVSGQVTTETSQEKFTWEAVKGISSPILSLAATKQAIYAGGYGGVWRITSDGSKFVKSSDGVNNITQIVPDPRNPLTLYAMKSSGGFPDITTDGGKSWQSLNVPEKIKWSILSYFLTIYECITVDPNNGTLTIGCCGGTNKGNKNTGILIFSNDGGKQWQASYPPDKKVSAVISTSKTLLFATDKGIYRFRNDDMKFDKKIKDSPINIISFLYDPTTLENPNSTVFYALTDNGVIYKSSDRGTTWLRVPWVEQGSTTMALTGVGISTLTMDPIEPRIFYSVLPRGIFKSTDGAYTWSLLMPKPEGVSTISSIVVDPNNPENIYIGTDKGLYKRIEATPTKTEVAQKTEDTKKPETVKKTEETKETVYGKVELTKMKEVPISQDFIISKTMEHYSDVKSVAFSPDGKMLASGGDIFTKLYSTIDGQNIMSEAIHSYSYSVQAVAFSPDGRYIVSGGSGGYGIRLWSTSSREKIKTLAEGKEISDVTSVAFSPNGKVLASGSYGGIKLWSIPDGRELKTLGEGTSSYYVAFSPDGEILASGGHGEIKLWSIVNEQELKTLTGHSNSNSVNSVAFSPDGQMLVSGSDDKTIKLWSIADGREIRTMTTDSYVLSVALSPDGQILASSHPDKTIKLWSVASGWKIMTLTGHTGEVNSVVFSPDGQTLASGGDRGDCKIKLWKYNVPRTPPYLMTNLTFDDQLTGKNGLLDALESAQLVVNISNTGEGSAYGVQLQFQSDNNEVKLPYAFQVGYIPPGHNATAFVPIFASSNLQNGSATIVLETKETNGNDAQTVRFSLPTHYVEPPKLVISPTVIVNDKTPSPVPIVAGGQIPNFKLTGILVTESYALAAINGKSVQVGSVVDGARVTKIEENKVFLNWEGKSIVLTLEEGTTFSSAIQGNGNSIIENEETVEIKLTVQNNGQNDAYGVKVSLVSLDSQIGVIGERETIIGDIKPAIPKEAKFNFFIPRSFTTDSLRFTIKVSDKRDAIPTAEKSFALPYRKREPQLFYSYKVLDGTPPSTRSRGNNNGSIEQGEIIELGITVENKGEISANNVSVKMTTDKQGIVISEGTTNIGNIPAGGKSSTSLFLFTVQRATQPGELPLDFSITQSDFSPQETSLSLEVIEEGIADIVVGRYDMKVGDAVLVKVSLEEAGIVYDIVLDPINPNIVYSATEKRGVLKSTNGGVDWVAINQGLDDLLVYCIVMDKTNPQILYVGTGNKGIYKSTDGGTTWVTINQGISPLFTVQCIAIDPTNPQIIYIGTKGGGIYKSTDGGGNWTQYIQGLPSTDVRCIVIDPKTPQTIYVGLAYGGLCRSTDSGNMYKVIFGTNTDDNIANAILSIVIDPRVSTTIYIGRGGSGIYCSRDGGSTWLPANKGLPASLTIGGQPLSIYSLGYDPINPMVMYAVARGGGIYISKDGGNSWMQNNYGLSNSTEADLRTLAINKTGKIFTGGSGGMYALGKVKEKQVISSVNFEFGSDQLKPEALVTLDKVVTTLSANPSLKALIEGHTDNIGTNEANLDLSYRRAKSVEQYLTGKGISINRLFFYGYGKTRPIVSNETEDGRAKNRRVELLVVE